MDASYLQLYENFELRHWWFVARREIIHEALARHVPADPGCRWLDVGCGTGVLMASYPAIADKQGLEMDAASVERAKSKGLRVDQTGIDWPLSRLGRFDVITLCDVLEHIQDDRSAVDAARAALKPGGILLVTVPALMGLWSGHDVVNRHYRRYTRPTLLRLFPPDCWSIVQATYFSSLLLPLIWAARKAKNLRDRGREAQPSHDFKFGPPWLDHALLTLFRLEKAPLRSHWFRFPLGSSILLVARNRASDAAAPS